MKKSFLTLLIVMCLFILNTGCGLDVFYVIESPGNYGANPDLNTTYADKYFQFTTNESASIEGLRVIGTDVYYKIYDDYNNLINDASYINNTDNNTSSKDKLVSSGKNFQPLRVENYNESVLIPSTGTNRLIYIRLTDYQENNEQTGDTFAARILIGGINGSSLTGGSKAIPVRNISDLSGYSRGFNFNKDNVRKPQSGDVDANITAASGDGQYYVCMYAVTVGVDAAFTNYFSEPTYLGYIKIDSTNTDGN